MRTIEVKYGTSRLKLVLNTIIGFSAWIDVGKQTAENETAVWFKVDTEPFIIDESLESFSQRYEAAMDEMESGKELAAIASQIEQALGQQQPFQPFAVQRCAQCGYLGSMAGHSCTT